MTTRVLLDSNVYDALHTNHKAYAQIRRLSDSGVLKVIATPMVADELGKGPFGGIPDWFPVYLEGEAVSVLDHAHLGMACLGEGKVFTEHRGESTKTPDAIIAESAHSLADILVSDDNRCRNRLVQISSNCTGMTSLDFVRWLDEMEQKFGAGTV